MISCLFRIAQMGGLNIQMNIQTESQMAFSFTVPKWATAPNIEIRNRFGKSAFLKEPRN
jgi:hypothetical protein